jgi:hypothetical protein
MIVLNYDIGNFLLTVDNFSHVTLYFYIMILSPGSRNSRFLPLVFKTSDLNIATNSLPEIEFW